ncbi:MAG: MFS transporter [Deltaproteobacteria bacterium]|jgi:MFS family permease
MSDKECPVPEPFSGAIGSVLFLTLLFFLTFIGRFIFAPLMPAMSSELGLSPSQAGSIFFFASMGVFIGSVSAGFVASRIQHKGTIAVSLIGGACALVLCTMLAPLWALRGALLMLGLMAGMNLPSNVATITALVSRQDWGKALAVQQMAPPLSLILGPMLTVFLLNWFSWRAPLVIIAIASIAAAVILIRYGNIGQFPGEAPDLSLARIILSGRSFWIMIILFALGMGGQVGIYAMMPLYLTAERGMPEASANMLIGLSQVSALFMTFFAGWVTDRIGEKRAISVFLLASGIVTLLLGLVSGFWLKIVVFLQPALIVCYFPAGFAALARIVQPNLRSLATAWVAPCAIVLGSGLFPLLLGYMGQTVTFASGIVLAGVIIIIGSGLPFFLNLIEKMDDGC